MRGSGGLWGLLGLGGKVAYGQGPSLPLEAAAHPLRPWGWGEVAGSLLWLLLAMVLLIGIFLPIFGIAYFLVPPWRRRLGRWFAFLLLGSLGTGLTAVALLSLWLGWGGEGMWLGGALLGVVVGSGAWLWRRLSPPRAPSGRRIRRGRRRAAR